MIFSIYLAVPRKCSPKLTLTLCTSVDKAHLLLKAEVCIIEKLYHKLYLVFSQLKKHPNFSVIEMGVFSFVSPAPAGACVVFLIR